MRDDPSEGLGAELLSAALGRWRVRSIRFPRRAPGGVLVEISAAHRHEMLTFPDEATLREWQRALLIETAWALLTDPAGGQIMALDLASLVASCITGQPLENRAVSPVDWDTAASAYEHCLSTCPLPIWPPEIEAALARAAADPDGGDVVWTEDGLGVLDEDFRIPSPVPPPLGLHLVRGPGWRPLWELVRLLPPPAPSATRTRLERRSWRVSGAVTPYESLAVERHRERLRFSVNTPPHMAQAPWLDEYVLWEAGEIFAEFSTEEACYADAPFWGFRTLSQTLARHPIVGGRGRAESNVCVSDSATNTARRLSAQGLGPGAIAAGQLLTARNCLLYGYHGELGQNVYNAYAKEGGTHTWIPSGEALKLARKRNIEVIAWRRSGNGRQRAPTASRYQAVRSAWGRMIGRCP